MTTLETIIQEERKLNELLREQNKQLHTQLQSLQKVNDSQAEQIHILTELVKNLNAKLYGRSSEKTKGLMNGQPVFEEVARLFNEAEVTQDEPSVEPDTPSTPRKTKQGHRMTETFGNLPEEDVIVRLEGEARICPDCGGTIEVVGIRHNRYEIEYTPATARLLNIQQETCCCPSCSKERGETVFVEPSTPEPVLQHSCASASSVAHVMYQKYV